MIKGVYLITDDSGNLLDRVSQALSGAVSTLQYRAKGTDYQARLAEGRELQKLCAARGVTFIVNDDLQLAAELGADGLHSGQQGVCVADARRILGPQKIIGVSTHSLEEALRAEADGADYIGFGAMFPTGSKEVSCIPGPLALAAVKPAVRIPVVAIGGINRDNAGTVIDTGADAIAVISAVLASADPALVSTELALLFNRRNPFPRGSVLTVAGSDCGGGAGIQADIKTITLLGSYAASAITALTAQNTQGVSSIQPIPPAFLSAQLDAVLGDIPVDVVKSGMLLSAEAVEALAVKLVLFDKKLLILDTVMIAKGGMSLTSEEAIKAMTNSLLPIAYLITPNIPEAERLTGLTISNIKDMQSAAKVLRQMGAKNVLVKGGHLGGLDATDIFYDGSNFTEYTTKKLNNRHTHGTGCVYSSAIATFLAQGEALPQAIARAKEFVTEAIRLALPMGKGQGPLNHYRATKNLTFSGNSEHQGS
jgi:hydroxymethylpyrimidine kinase / phosphomethylpyrimidine kinase / thiamine-phosphate diphosphorylase